VRELVLPELERHGPIEAWIIDDTSFPKKGQHSGYASTSFHVFLGVGLLAIVDTKLK
jgi:SRSO17 transposase